MRWSLHAGHWLVNPKEHKEKQTKELFVGQSNTFRCLPLTSSFLTLCSFILCVCVCLVSSVFFHNRVRIPVLYALCECVYSFTDEKSKIFSFVLDWWIQRVLHKIDAISIGIMPVNHFWPVSIYTIHSLRDQQKQWKQQQHQKKGNENEKRCIFSTCKQHL